MNQLKVLIITTIICLSSVAQAQFFKANVLGTVNFAQVDGDHIGGYNKFGINPGIGIYHEMDDTKAYGFEIVYAQKGSKLVNDPDAAVQPIFIIKSAYIEFPMYFQLKLNTIDALSVHTGVSVGVNISGTIDDGPRVSDAEFNAIASASLLGGSYHFSENLSFRVRHGLSINRIGGNYPVKQRTFNRFGMYNRWFNVGFVFGLGG